MHNIDQFIEFSEDIIPLRERKQTHLQEAVFISQLHQGKWIPNHRFSETYKRCLLEDEQGDWADLRESIIKMQDLEEKIFSPLFDGNTRILEEYYHVSSFQNRRRLIESQLDDSLDIRRQELNEYREQFLEYNRQHLKEFLPAAIAPAAAMYGIGRLGNYMSQNRFANQTAGYNAANPYQVQAVKSNADKFAANADLARQEMANGASPLAAGAKQLGRNALGFLGSIGRGLSNFIPGVALARGMINKRKASDGAKWEEGYKQGAMDHAAGKADDQGMPVNQEVQAANAAQAQGQQNAPDINQLMNDVKAGKYGQGQARKQALDQQFGPGVFEQVQNAINQEAGDTTRHQAQQSGNENQQQQGQDQQQSNQQQESRLEYRNRLREKKSLENITHDINKLVEDIRNGKIYLIDKYSEALLEDAAEYCTEEEWPVIRETIIHLEDLEEQIFSGDFYSKKSANSVLEEYFNVALFNSQQRLTESFEFEELQERRNQLDYDLCNVYALREVDASAAAQSGENPSLIGRMASTLAPGMLVSSALRPDGLVNRFMPWGRAAASGATRPGLLSGFGNMAKGAFNGIKGLIGSAGNPNAVRSIVDASGRRQISAAAANAARTGTGLLGKVSGLAPKLAGVGGKIAGVAGKVAAPLAIAGGAVAGYAGVNKLLNYFGGKNEAKDAQARQAAMPTATDNKAALEQKAAGWKATMGDDELPWSLSNAMEVVKEAEKRGHRETRLQEAIPLIGMALSNPLIGGALGAVGGGLGALAKRGFGALADWWNSKEIANNAAAVAQAKPKDFVRINGEKVKLSQADIDYAKKVVAGQGAGSQTQSQANQQAAANPADANWTAPEAATTPDQLAQQIMDGKWGNDPDRTRRLQANGMGQMMIAAKQIVNQKLGPAAAKPIPTPEERAGEAHNPNASASQAAEQAAASSGLTPDQQSVVEDILIQLATGKMDQQKAIAAAQAAGIPPQKISEIEAKFAQAKVQTDAKHTQLETAQKTQDVEIENKPVDPQKPDEKAGDVAAEKTAEEIPQAAPAIQQAEQEKQQNPNKSYADLIQEKVAKGIISQELADSAIEAYNKNLKAISKRGSAADEISGMNSANNALSDKMMEIVTKFKASNAGLPQIKQEIENSLPYKQGLITKVTPEDTGIGKGKIHVEFRNGGQFIFENKGKGWSGSTSENAGGEYLAADDAFRKAKAEQQGTQTALDDINKRIGDSETAHNERIAAEKAQSEYDTTSRRGRKPEEMKESVNSLINYYYNHLN